MQGPGPGVREGGPGVREGPARESGRARPGSQGGPGLLESGRAWPFAVDHVPQAILRRTERRGMLCDLLCVAVL